MEVKFVIIAMIIYLKFSIATGQDAMGLLKEEITVMEVKLYVKLVEEQFVTNDSI